MRICKALPTAAVVFLSFVEVFSARAGNPLPVQLQRDVHVTMRDGVVLHADIYRPAAEGKFPVLLERTPYDKNAVAEFGVKAAGRGYVVIVEDVRGRFASEGDWYPFKFESQDGYDTVEWAAALPYANGKVGMFGESYRGATQFLTAIAHPPHLSGLAPSNTPSNYHNGWVYQGGAFELGFNESWTTGLAVDTIGRHLAKSGDFEHATLRLPLEGFPLFAKDALPAASEWTARYAPYFDEWLAHPNYDDYWRRLSIEDHYADIQVPVLIMTAWYDIFQGGALHNFTGLQQHAGNDFARQHQRLVITIGGHAGDGRKIGDIDFGPEGDKFSEDDLILSWYDYLLKGQQNEWATNKPVHMFVMGTNVWRDEDQWPLARAREGRYFLRADGPANSSDGRGLLSEQPPRAETGDTYVYDPAAPVPTTGGPLCCEGIHFAGGPKDQRPVEQRNDVLVYSTGAFAKNTEVTGPVHVDLYVKSSAVDTDFTAKLVDVWPNGYAQNLTEGILRAKYRNSQQSPTLLVPGDVYKLDIDLWSTSNVFLAGHSLRLEVSSSNFPRFDGNLNTGRDAADAVDFTKATNVVLHDAEHPSALVVSIVEP